MKVAALLAALADVKYADYDVCIMDIDEGYALLPENIQFDDDGKNVVFTDGKPT